jgi:hypothetical protein
VLDLRHIIPREIVHQLAGDVRDVNRADLIDQDLGVPARDDGLRRFSLFLVPSKKLALRQRFAGLSVGSWTETQSRRWRQEPYRRSMPGAAMKGKSMYIGIGTIVLIVIIVLVVLMLRRRLCYAARPRPAV